ncbi:MAG: energy transducer TonB [Muribaculaceae bacterium]|nr:energy transducer TonB [Muribaculaceae bacterium]
MPKGKQTCKILKEIRRQIAVANDIDLVIEECRYKGDCLGTCPRCEAEVRYLETQLQERRLSGRAVALAGVSAGMLLMAGGSTAKAGSLQSQSDLSVSAELKTELTAVTADTVAKRDIIFGMVNYQQARYPDGDKAMMDFIRTNIVYPEDALRERIEGRVVVKMRIEADGTISDYVIIRGRHPSLDREAVRVLKLMPKFEPATDDGRPVAVWFTIPVNFKLPKADL